MFDKICKKNALFPVRSRFSRLIFLLASVKVPSASISSSHISKIYAGNGHPFNICRAALPSNSFLNTVHISGNDKLKKLLGMDAITIDLIDKLKFKQFMARCKASDDIEVFDETFI